MCVPWNTSVLCLRPFACEILMEFIKAKVKWRTSLATCHHPWMRLIIANGISSDWGFISTNKLHFLKSKVCLCSINREIHMLLTSAGQLSLCDQIHLEISKCFLFWHVCPTLCWCSAALSYRYSLYRMFSEKFAYKVVTFISFFNVF